MKRYRIGRAALATMMSLAVGLGITACSRDYTVAYVYATSAQTGAVSAFDVDYQSGSLVQIAGSPFSSGLHNPVTLVVHPSSKLVYVIGGNQDDSIAEMAIGTDGKLYGQNTYPVGGHSPTAAAIDASGNYLFVTFALQNLYTTASPGPGGVTIYKINNTASDPKYGSLSSPVTVNLGNNPVAVATSALTPFVYILDADTNSSGTGAGQLLAFSENATTGVLTPVTCPTPTPVGCTSTVLSSSGGKTTATGISAGTTPTAIAEDPTSRFVYVTDRATNQLYGYLVQGSTFVAPGSLVPMQFGPFTTGQFPVAVTIEPRGKYMYTANFGSSTVSSYAIDPASGSPSGVAGLNSTVGTGPTCVTVEPALGIYLYTSNRLDGSVSGAQLDPHTGILSNIENSPFSTSAQLSCVAAAANGEHSLSLPNP